MNTTKKSFTTPVGEVTYLTLTNSKGNQVVLSSLGAGIVAITVPDRDGNRADVVIGYPEASDYIADGPCAGKTPGRYANRIANGRFTLEGNTYTLPVNNGPNHLHGGPDGYQNRVWNVDETAEGKARMGTQVIPPTSKHPSHTPGMTIITSPSNMRRNQTAPPSSTSQTTATSISEGMMQVQREPWPSC